MRSSVALQVVWYLQGRWQTRVTAGGLCQRRVGSPGEEAIGEGSDDYDSTKVQPRSSAN